MFNFIIKTKNAKGIISTRLFETASNFLETCESDNITISMEDIIVSVTYGGYEVHIPEVKIVNDLYCWMCSDSCNWF